MNTQTKQALIRQLSPQYLAENPPIGIVENLAAITARLAPTKMVEFRKPFARKPDDCDERPECHMCQGENEIWSTEDQRYVDCPYCGGDGTLPFMENQAFVTVWRDSHSIETLATVLPTGEVNAFVTVNEPGHPKGSRIELTPEEVELAKATLRQ